MAETQSPAAPAAAKTTKPALPAAIKLTATQAGFVTDKEGVERHYHFADGAVIHDPAFITIFVERDVPYTVEA